MKEIKKEERSEKLITELLNVWEDYNWKLQNKWFSS